MHYEAFIQQVIDQHLPPGTLFKDAATVAGGCINSAYRITTNNGPYFLKWNQEELLPMFRSEVQGLQKLDAHSPIQIPKTIASGTIESNAYLLLEWIEKGSPISDFWEHFGSSLAQQHQQSSEHFGLDHDNFIGKLPQSNTPHTSWYEFFILERLEPQLRMATSGGLVERKDRQSFDVLFKKLEQYIPEESPALLHGDLWNGNFMIAHSGHAAIFDPAVHYGHRETELAFTQLFGGFSDEFYASYQRTYPLQKKFEDRVELHNLYPLLVHVNLFGVSYLSGIRQTLKRFA